MESPPSSPSAKSNLTNEFYRNLNQMLSTELPAIEEDQDEKQRDNKKSNKKIIEQKVEKKE